MQNLKFKQISIKQINSWNKSTHPKCLIKATAVDELPRFLQVACIGLI
ncbi:hypothetical protein FDUTEX481_02202 [Tolypothrix sp. PCC 7601]|nr:hypothetical protein FDUTEX481_02202 [Tolypothrix sp. PCC 7601]